MTDFTFKAIGTTWNITTDSTEITEKNQETILKYVADFERSFSRFITDSEVNLFRNAKPGHYSISPEFTKLLTMGDKLRTLTEGVYDPAAGELLEKTGYNNSYTLKPSKQIANFSLPHWTLQEETLTLDGPTAFDLGGIGKGYCIDQVAGLLIKLGHKHLMVDAGGDMFGTTKSDGSPWRVAIQYPGKPDIAAGVAELNNQAIAVSDSFRRRWGKWHHLVDPKKMQPIQAVIGAVSVTPSAWYADCMTSVLFLGSENSYESAAKEFHASYLVFKEDGTCLVSPNWEGKLFK